MGRKLKGEEKDEDQVQCYHEEWGIEVDLLNGVHSSIKLPAMFQFANAKGGDPVADPTLFGSHEFVMSKDEEVFVTSLMTSSDTTKLATAAQILHGITNNSRGDAPDTS